MTKARALELGRLAIAAAAIPLAGWLFWAFVLHLGPNDFHDYWLAGKLLAEGHSPYDTQAMAALAAREHLTFLIGGGYSYPLPFALVMVPFAALPFEVAVTLFNAVSLVAFGLTVAAWLGWAYGWGPETSRRRLALALAAGVYPPVYGTVAMGQANLVVLPVLALGAVLALDGSTAARRAAGGMLIGLASIVKLVPGVWLVPLALGRRFGAAAGVAVAALGTLAASMAIAPWAAAGSGGLTSLLDADAFYSNQSINGFVSRLVTGTDKSVAVWSGAFDPRPVMLGLTGAFALATLAILWRARRQLGARQGLAFGLALALVAGTIGAPKTSFWNESIVLVAVGLLWAGQPVGAAVAQLGRIDRALLAAWFGSALTWAVVWAVEPPAMGPLSAVVTLAWSASLYGLLALWLVLARRLSGATVQLSAAAAQATIS
jgi:hypothetical protein